MPHPTGDRVKLLPVGDLSSPNLAIARLDGEPHDGSRPQLVIASFSDEDSPSTTLDLAIDGQRISSQH